MATKTTTRKTTSPRKLISLTEAGDLLAVSSSTIRRLIASGDLAGYRIGTKAIRVDQAEVLELARPVPTTGDPYVA